MCGCYADAREEELADALDVEVVAGHREPSRNIRPTQLVWVVAAAAQPGGGAAVREMGLARWGLVPSWSKVLPSQPLINARAETATVKPSFRVAAARRRAILPAIGYYEWLATPGGKTPYFLHRADDAVLGFAGLYEWWKVPDGVAVKGAEDGWLRSVTILTRTAADSIGQIHERMPVVVPRDLAHIWLDPELTIPSDVDGLLRSFADPELVPVQLSPA